MEDVATTEYSFGCFRDPMVRLGDGDATDDEREESAIKRKGMWTRTVSFEKVQARVASNDVKSERAVCEKEHGFPPHPRKKTTTTTTTNSEKERRRRENQDCAN